MAVNATPDGPAGWREVWGLFVRLEGEEALQMGQQHVRHLGQPSGDGPARPPSR